MPPRTAEDAEAVVVEDVAAIAVEGVDAAEDAMETVAGAEEAKAGEETTLRARTTDRTMEKVGTRIAGASGAESAAVAADKAASRVEANPEVDHGRLR